MIVAGLTMAAGSGVPAGARELAARLSALFERDAEIVARLNDAQQRLCDANERLWSGVSPDGWGLMYDGAAPSGTSQIATLVDDTGSQTVLLGALQDAHWAIHRAFLVYQFACEERRQLAVDVGELARQLTEVLCAVGWSAAEARAANVHELAGVVL